MAFEHRSGLPAAFDRASAGPSRARLVFPERAFLQGADLNELQSLEARRTNRVGNMTAQDGDRIAGCDILYDGTTLTATMAAGQVYVAGDVRPVAAAVLSNVAKTGEVVIGVRLQRTLVTSDDDPSLLGLMPGTDAEGEPGAAREEEKLVWAVQGDAQVGDFFGVYVVRDGTVIDQSPPAALTGVYQAIALYDRDANGNYIVDGCEVTALGKIGSDQVFSIAAGTANIWGWKRVREYAMRHAEPEAPDLESVAAEPGTFSGATGGQTVLTVLRPPIQAVTQAIVVKRITETVVRGSTAGGTDALTKSSVVAIESVTQSSTTFATNTFTLAGDSISWAPAGAEPAASSTYSVTYLYNEAVTPVAVTDTTVTVAGGVNGTTTLLSYTSKLPRVDLLCLDLTGRPVYVKGISARQGALTPIAPSTLLKLCEVWNRWLGAPSIVNNGTRNYTYDAMRRYFDRLVDILEQFDRADARRDILEREPVSKNGIFTDTFVDDFYRDQGAAQTAAVVGGALQLAVDAILIQRMNASPVTLDWTETVVVRQDKRTSSIQINPYANFAPFPAGLKLEPATDFWTDQQTVWTSPVTMELTAAPNTPPDQQTYNDTISETQVAAETLRQISVAFTVAGFGVGENLSKLTFDGVNVKPPGTQTADANGVIAGTFNVPAGIPVGTRLVRAEGAAGSFAEAYFVGNGIIDVSTMRRVTLVTRAAPVPITINVTQVTNVINTTVIQQLTNPVVQAPMVGSGGNFEGHGSDPLAQTFTLPEPRHVVGVNVRFAVIGNRAKGVRVQLVTVLNGYPTTEILAEQFLNMQPVVVGALTPIRFDVPIFLRTDREYAFVFLTDDNTHELSIAKLGDVDQTTQTFVSSQAYTVGVLLASANRLTWTPIQEADLCFQIVAATFAPTTKTVTLWTGALNQISDVVVRAAVEIPTEVARLRFELVRANNSFIQLAPEQVMALAEFVTETVTLRAVLTGSDTIGPVLYPGATLIGGRLRTSGTYVTRLFPMGSNIRVAALFAAFLPAGAGVSVDVDAGDGNWTAMSANGSGTLGSGWTEPKWQKTAYTATQGRVRITMTGNPGARPSVARLRAYSL
ncbi:MAG: DUF4815 domain-containing protein [Alsobacter sp.]